jgi:glycosyltransferase involved in cell wall biosynthesis
MRVCVTTDQRFARTPDAALWAPAGPAYAFWSRYLSVFDDVCLIARVADVSGADPAWKRVDGQGVGYAPVPHYLGATGYALRRFQVQKALRSIVTDADAVVLRVSSILAISLESSFISGRPLGLEVIGDPYEVFAPGSIQHPLRPGLRWWLTKKLKSQCERACAVAYVTENTLQKRYPAGPAAFQTSYSSIELPDDQFVQTTRSPNASSGAAEVVTIGSLEQMYKGFDVLVDAVARCVSWGFPVQLTIIGEGRCRPQLEQRIHKYGLTQHVTLAGHLHDRRQICDLLDSADLFVLPSKTEGLPRAMIEAMARGLPCIGTDVGGIPELLSRDNLVPRGDALALAHKMIDVLKDRTRMAHMAATNVHTARRYCDSVLKPKREEFLQYIRRVTQQWGKISDHTGRSRTLASAAI